MPNEVKIAKSYVLHLEPEFDKQLQEEYIDYFKENGIPSKNKQAAVFDLCRSLPAYNKNDMGIRPEVLEASYKTIENTLGDLNHDRNLVIGSTMKSELIRQGENEPIIMRICAVFSKDRLRDNPYYSIESISDQNGFSMEALFSNWEYLVNGTILTRQDRPDITEDQVENLIEHGEVIYDSQGNRIILLLGTIDDPIEFNGFAVIVNEKRPADPQSDRTFLEVASEKNNNNNLNNQGVDNLMSYKVFETENDYNAVVAGIIEKAKAEAKIEAKAELQPSIEQLESDLKSIKATITEKENTITDLTGKLQTAEASITTEKTRADAAEIKLNEIATAKLVEDRKQVLASKNYEVDEDDVKMLATASQNEFDVFVKRIEKAQASVKKATASQIDNELLSISLTGENDSLTANDKLTSF